MVTTAITPAPMFGNVQGRLCEDCLREPTAQLQAQPQIQCPPPRFRAVRQKAYHCRQDAQRACLRRLRRVDAGEGWHAASMHSMGCFDNVGALGLPENLPEIHHRNHPRVDCRRKERPCAHRRQLVRITCSHTCPCLARSNFGAPFDAPDSNSAWLQPISGHAGRVRGRVAIRS